MREKLSELLKDADELPFDTYDGAVDFLIANGVTIVPCKIGDEFWTDYVGLTKVKCSMLTQKANGTWLGRFTVENGGGSSINRPLDEIGKTLFRTKEDAAEAMTEKAQKEMYEILREVNGDDE